MARTFGPPASDRLQDQIRQAAQQLFDAAGPKRPVRGGDFAMDQTEQIVIYEADIKLPDGQRLRIAQTLPTARPPFEWFMEVTSDIGEADYFKHYLIREHDIMLAERKNLTPIDEPEAQLILHDLGVARAGL